MFSMGDCVINNRESAIYGCLDPLVMGIVNFTPDSFYEGSRCSSSDLVLDKIGRMIDAGADIIDVGACSTRPGGVLVTEEEESSRLFSLLELVRKKFPDVLLSVDTFRANIAFRSVRDFGVNIINDVSSFDLDEKMLEVLSSLNVPYVLMHHDETSHISDMSVFLTDILSFFEKKLEVLKAHGVGQVVIDPGYGFGKSMEQNYYLLAHQSVFKKFDCPILAGLSRKRMVWQTLGCSPDEALNGTTVLNVLALRQGASILRVHDVREAKEAVRLCRMYGEFSED